MIIISSFRKIFIVLLILMLTLGCDSDPVAIQSEDVRSSSVTQNELKSKTPDVENSPNAILEGIELS